MGNRVVNSKCRIYMMTAGLYKRNLQCPPAIKFGSAKGKQLFSEAFQGGTMEGFFKIMPYFQTQNEMTYCGLASLSMVLNALEVDPGRKWKGPWRWFDENMFRHFKSLDKVKANGMTLDMATDFARSVGTKVEVFPTNRSSISHFRNYVKRCTSSEDCHLIALYDRKSLKQTGSGHFSPIGGYHAGTDMILILDVARFKYPPHWVPLPLLWDAMNTFLEATEHFRGFMVLSRLPSGDLASEAPTSIPREMVMVG